MDDRLQAVREDFPAAARMSYLNTGTVAMMPTPVLERLVALMRWYNELGPGLPEASQRRRDEMQGARGRMAEFLGAGVEEVQFVTDTTAGMNAVISSLRLEEGDEVLVSDIEHPVGRVPWKYAADRSGLKIRVVPARGAVVEVDDVRQAVTDRTRVISLSHVSFLTGGRQDLAAIGALAREAGIILLVDAAQSVGALDIDMGELNCDALAFPGYKWCLGPQGSGGLYVSERLWECLEPPFIAMGATQEADIDGNYTLSGGADLYSPSTGGLMQPLGLSYSLEYLMDLGMDWVQERIETLTTRFIDGLMDISRASLVTPEAFSGRAGLVSFSISGFEERQAMRELTEEFLSRGVYIRIVPRPLAFRASFHIFNSDRDVDRLLELVEDA